MSRDTFNALDTRLSFCLFTFGALGAIHIDLMEAEERPYEPPWPSRATSSLIIGGVGFLCRSFLYAFSKTEVHGLERLLSLIDERADPEKRERGLITGKTDNRKLDDSVG